MSNYEFIKTIPNDTFLSFINRGFIPVHIMDYLTVYECYLLESAKNKKSVAITFCSEKYNVTERTIRNVITFMQN